MLLRPSVSQALLLFLIAERQSAIACCLDVHTYSLDGQGPYFHFLGFPVVFLGKIIDLELLQDLGVPCSMLGPFSVAISHSHEPQSCALALGSLSWVLMIGFSEHLSPVH